MSASAGHVPAGMSNLPITKCGFEALPATVTDYSFRADSACYDDVVLKWLADPKRTQGPAGLIGFTISADMSPELKAQCNAIPEPAWMAFEDRPEETVHCAEVEFTPGNWRKEAQPLRYLALHITKKQGRLFEEGGQTKHLAVVTNREGESADLHDCPRLPLDSPNRSMLQNRSIAPIVAVSSVCFLLLLWKHSNLGGTG